MNMKLTWKSILVKNDSACSTSSVALKASMSWSEMLDVGVITREKSERAQELFVTRESLSSHTGHHQLPFKEESSEGRNRTQATVLFQHFKDTINNLQFHPLLLLRPLLLFLLPHRRKNHHRRHHRHHHHH